MQEKPDADAANGDTTSRVADSKATVASDPNADEFCSFVSGILPGVPARDLLAGNEIGVAGIRRHRGAMATHTLGFSGGVP